MKKLRIGLLGMLACATMVNADGFSEADRELIGAKDFPFPPDQGEENSTDQPTGPADRERSYDPYNPPPQEENSSGFNSPDQEPAQTGGRSEKEYVPEVQNNKNKQE